MNTLSVSSSTSVKSGVAGGADKSVAQMDIVVCEKIAHHDIWCGPGTQYGEAAGCPLFFHSDDAIIKHLHTSAKSALKYGLICSGDDDQVVPLLSLGGKGVISVVSNVKPELVHNCCKAWFEGDTKTACKLQLEILPLADALFCEVNPIPVKYAMNVLGWEAGSCRLPLVEPSDAHKEKIEQALEAEGLIQE